MLNYFLEIYCLKLLFLSVFLTDIHHDQKDVDGFCLVRQKKGKKPHGTKLIVGLLASVSDDTEINVEQLVVKVQQCWYLLIVAYILYHAHTEINL